MSWFRSEFDKLLMAALVVMLLLMPMLNNEKVTPVVLVLAGNCMGCLLTLVVGKRGQTPDAPDPTESVTDTTTNTKTKTILPPPV